MRRIWGLLILLMGFGNARGAELDDRAIARAAVGELAGHAFGQLTARFDDKLRTQATTDTLQQAWLALEGQSGKLLTIGEGAEAPAKGVHRVDVTVAFERASWTVKLGFDAQHKLVALTFGPAAAVPETLAPNEQRLTVGAGTIALPAILSLPKGEGPFPSVVLVHGSGPHDADETIGPNKPFRDLAQSLSARGIAVLRYEKRSHAGLLPSHATYTVNEETIDDARAAVALLTRTPKIDGKRIYVAGHSLGGMLAPRIAAKNPSVAGLIILAGNTRPFEELVLEQMKKRGTPKQIADAEAMVKAVRDPKLSDGDWVECAGARLPGSYFLDLRGYHPAAAAAALTVPMLVLQGERDIQVTLDDFAGWQAALGKRPGVTLKRYPTLTHLFMPGIGAPADYGKPQHVSDDVVVDIAAFVGK